MGRTLFWYLFRDLLRVFFLAALVLAGIMSFGGLLRPLTKHGLDAWQVAKMWLYLMPAMMTYSLPVAAVFAASVIYGRLAADNELTACRAAGISYRSVCAPALALGLVSAFTSLLFLSYVVPFFTYQVERVIYANVAKVVAAEIQQTHGFRMSGGPTIFAQEAYIPPESGANGQQTLVLVQPTLITPAASAIDPTIQVPQVISIARKATLHIQQDAGNQIQVWGVLDGGTSFTRELGGGPEVGIAATSFGPIDMPSPLEQNVKFMDIARLRKLATEPEKLDRVRNELRRYISLEQQQILLSRVVKALEGKPDVGYTIAAAEPCEIVAAGASYSYTDTKRGRELTIKRGPHPIRVTRRHANGRVVLHECAAADIWLEIIPEYRFVVYHIEMDDVVTMVQDSPAGAGRASEVVAKRASVAETSFEPMSKDVEAVFSRRVSDYIGPNSPIALPSTPLLRERLIATNDITAELHSRASFAMSCLVLVLVGAVLGMQFRSGDFLTAFAVSVIPALLTITLVVAGLQVARHVSRETLSDPIAFAVVLIWLGNAIAATLAGVLYLRIRRT